jgi:hypothetical protein
MGGEEMEMRGRTFNSPIVIGVANKHGRDARGTRRLHVQRGVAHVPDRRIGRPAEL